VKAGDLISGKYRLHRLLGAGGMGSVWAVRNELTDRDFAIKFLHPKLADNKEALQRFFLEARACGQIKHPAVVDVYDMGQAEDGSPYLVMELLEGEGFDQRLGRAGCFRPSEAATWIAFVARGLEEAHVRGLVHRDLKPGNVFFALDDRGDVIPKILDFGVSKATNTGAAGALGSGEAELILTSTGAVLGSPAYMSPEQARGDTDVDTRSDVWSLGVILYEALTGKIPFDAPNYNALMVAIITRPHKPVAEVAPGVPVELSQIVDLALAKERTERIATARDLAERLEALATRITVSPPAMYSLRTPTLIGASPIPRSTTQSTWTEAPPARVHNRGTTALAASFLGAALIIGGVVGYYRMRSPTVSVAGRCTIALAAGLARLKADIDRDALASRSLASVPLRAIPTGDPPGSSSTRTASLPATTATAAADKQPAPSSTLPQKGAPTSKPNGSKTVPRGNIPVSGPGF
jgi:eukaryotic-like serine/threonine-protein kinase